MQHFPIFITVQNRQIVLSGGGAAAVAKLRLLMKTEAKIMTFAAKACDEIKTWAAQDRLQLVPRALKAGDVTGAVLFYAELKKLKIASELHVYGDGGHGYGLRKVPGSQISTWTDHAAHWLAK